MENGSETKTSKQVKSEEKPVEIKATGDDKAIETKAEDVKTTDVKADEVKIEKIEADEIKTDRTKTDEVETDKDKADEVKAEQVKAEYVEEKSEESCVVAPKELLNQIKTQVEFYFGDINLQRDKFLIEQRKLDGGWIPMTVMLNFKLLASMSKDPKVIAKALESSELMEVSEDCKKIRRSVDHPLPTYDEAYRKSQAERTVYMKGFPLTDIYIQKLKEFFKDYEPFENIVMRKYLDKEKKLKFKGSIFVQFKTLDGAKAFMARESVKYNDTELIRKYSEDYVVEKAKEKEERKQKKGEKKGDKKTEENERDSEPETEETIKVDLPKGSIVHFTGSSEEITREMIKNGLMKLGGDVAYIDYQIGKSGGWIRLQEADAGKVLVDKMKDSQLKIKNDLLTFRTLDGEEEATYLATVEQKMKNMRCKSKNPKRSRGRRVRPGGQRGRKRHGSPAHGAVASKKNVLE